MPLAGQSSLHQRRVGGGAASFFSSLLKANQERTHPARLLERPRDPTESILESRDVSAGLKTAAPHADRQTLGRPSPRPTSDRARCKLSPETLMLDCAHRRPYKSSRYCRETRDRSSSLPASFRVSCDKATSSTPPGYALEAMRHLLPSPST